LWQTFVKDGTEGAETDHSATSFRHWRGD